MEQSEPSPFGRDFYIVSENYTALSMESLKSILLLESRFILKKNHLHFP